MSQKFLRKRIYLDHASSAPTLRAARHILNKYTKELFANPSAIHADAIFARRVLEDSRRKAAEILGALPREIVFTSGGTESNNLALWGAVLASGKKIPKPHIIVSLVEHPSVLQSARALEGDGVAVSYLSVDKYGVVDLLELEKLLRPETVLVSIQYVNNEIGAIQPISEIVKIIRRYKKSKAQNPRPKIANNNVVTFGSSISVLDYPLFHTDACQAPNYLPVNVSKLGVDLMALNSQKVYGPKGVGLLYIKDKVPIIGIQAGGGQERGLRAGTENVPAIAAFAYALQKIIGSREKEAGRLEELSRYFIEMIKKEIPNVRINGDEYKRLPNIVNISIPGISSEYVVMELDAKGISASEKSACKMTDENPSHVLRAIYGEDGAKDGSIRFSLGRSTKKSHLQKTISALRQAIDKARLWE